MNKINKEKLEKLISKNPELLIADMRSPVDYRDGHIDNSINLPLKNFVNKLMGLPRNTVVVAYSANFDDVDLVQGMNYAQQLGFTKLHIAEYSSIK